MSDEQDAERWRLVQEWLSIDEDEGGDIRLFCEPPYLDLNERCAPEGEMLPREQWPTVVQVVDELAAGIAPGAASRVPSGASPAVNPEAEAKIAAAWADGVASLKTPEEFDATIYETWARGYGLDMPHVRLDLAAQLNFLYNASKAKGRALVALRLASEALSAISRVPSESTLFSPHQKCSTCAHSQHQHQQLGGMYWTACTSPECACEGFTIAKHFGVGVPSESPTRPASASSEEKP